MIRLLYPNIDEEEAVEKITDKMRPEIMSGLALHKPETIEELVDLASRIESKEKRIGERVYRANNYTRYKPEYNRMYEKQVSTSSNGENNDEMHEARPTVKCYKCNRLGHISRDCRATHTIVGKPPRERKIHTRTGESVNAIQYSEPRLEFNRTATTSDTIHTIAHTETKKVHGPKTVSDVHVSFSESIPSSRQLLYQTLSCNGVKVVGMIDTGSYHSVVDEEVAQENGWTIEGRAPVLGAAGNNPLECIGACKLKIELTINKRTRSVRHSCDSIGKLGDQP